MLEYGQMSTNDKSSLRRPVILHLLMAIIVIAMFVWAYYIIKGNGPEKAGWLLLPLTAIYVVSNIYIAIAGMQSARASASSAAIMEQTVREMQLSTNAMYAPWISFPKGYNYSVTETGDAKIHLTNLFNQPAAGLQVLLWELEVGEEGRKSCKYSSLRESPPTDFLGNTRDTIFILEDSQRSDAEKFDYGNLTWQRFIEVHKREPQNSLCLMLYHTKISNNPIILVWDLEEASLDRPRKHLSARKKLEE
jgi:hypothetical protein